MIADINPLLLTSMAESLERDPRFFPLARLSTAEGFLSMMLRLQAQTKVIDWNLPAPRGVRLIEVLRVRTNAPRMMIYAYDSGDTARTTMMAGAAGFAARSESVDWLLDNCVAVD